MATPAKKGMKPTEFLELWETARLDVELAKRGYIREITKLESVAVFMDKVYEGLIGEEPPAYEPEFRIVKAS